MTVSVYATSFIAAILGFNLLYYYSFYNDKNHLIYFGDLEAKTQHYLSSPSQYNLIFLGDSRTYCAIQPDLVDAALGSHSYNLSRFSHWFPTQYAQIMDIIEAIPQNTTVVWSVGHQNFSASNVIRRIYPIRVGYVPDFLTMGFTLSDLVDNVTYYHPLTHFFAKRSDFRERVMNVWGEDLLTLEEIQPTASGTSADGSHVSRNERQKLKAKSAYLIRQFQNDYSYAVRVLEEKSRITSVVLYKRQGSYHRIELDREFFRIKQKEKLIELGGTVTGIQLEDAMKTVEGDEKYLHLFERVLGEFKRHGIDLVVNEFQEAPFTYRSPTYRKAWSIFMQTKIKPLVEAYGFQYITVDFENLKDWHYFDYKHLNDRGIRVFTPMLVEQLKQLPGKK